MINWPTSDSLLEDSCKPREDDWPRDPESGRPLCTPERPMPKGDPGRWAHLVCEETDSSDYSRWVRCKGCGVTWSEELPE